MEAEDLLDANLPAATQADAKARAVAAARREELSGQ
jgi:hypothetical protein